MESLGARKQGPDSTGENKELFPCTDHLGYKDLFTFTQIQPVWFQAGL